MGLQTNEPGHGLHIPFPRLPDTSAERAFCGDGAPSNGPLMVDRILSEAPQGRPAFDVVVLSHLRWNFVYQPEAVINYPNDHAYTRVTEFKYLTGQQHAKTSIVSEFPRAEGDPYYPVPRPENTERYLQYKDLADATPNVQFVGRLATYKYYNMDQVVGQALAVFDRIAATQRDVLIGIETAPTWRTTTPRSAAPLTTIGASHAPSAIGALLPNDES